MTREEELIRIAKKLDKMVSRNNTETRIGMSVNGIRKHCSDEEVIALAKFLIKDWKRLLGNTILRRCLCCLVMINGYFILMTDSGSNGKTSENKNGLESMRTTESPPPHPSPSQSHIRDKCIEMIAAALRFDSTTHNIKATDMKYKNRVNVLARSIELSRIATMTSEEMASDELKQLRNVLTQEAIREHQMAKTSGTSTDMLQCSKCRKKNCTYNQVQTRSADEPMTTFVLCNECGNRWKVF
uniref:Transcription elongation factor A (SII), 3 n=1 Tax=Neogobius melanostomus TaxID=47308 RepID=A0A8C6SQX3_9GOBI